MSGERLSMDVQEMAAWLRQRRFAITFLRPGEKRPTRKGWTLASQEPADHVPGSNLGVMTGALSGGLVCVDLDSADALRLADEYLPPTDMVEGRPSKARSHRYYRVTEVPPDVTSTAAGGMGGPATKRFAGILDLQGTGAMCVVPPSLHPSGERRSWCDRDGKHIDEPGEPTTLPFTTLWEAVCKLATACGWKPPEPRRHQSRPAKEPAAAPTPAAVEQARAYLANVPPAVAGRGGHDATYRVARLLVNDFGLSEVEAWPLLSEFNGRCVPPWSEDELRRKLRSAVEAGPSACFPSGSKADGNRGGAFEAHDDAHRLAAAFPDGDFLRYWRGEWWQWDWSRYGRCRTTTCGREWCGR
jgi:hypothetical protein